LHCVICYEEFNLTDRYPVVLPCGHTYVCVVCTKRIKICHECREPLFWHPPKPQQPAVTNHNSHIHRSPATSRYSRYNHSRYSPSTPTPQANGTNGAKREEVPLPLPKNVVLMEMIEAKERQERLVAEEKESKLKKKQEKLREKQLKLERRREEKANLSQSRQPDTSRGSHRPAITQHRSVDSEEIEVGIHQDNPLLYDEIGDDELDYDDEISSSSSSEMPLGDPELVTGYAALSGFCGTYAVREPQGLLVLPQDPNRQRYHVTQEHGDEKKEGSPHSSTRFSSIFNSAEDDESVDSVSMKNLRVDSDSIKNLKSSSTQYSSTFNSADDDGSVDDVSKNLRSLHSRNEPFTLQEGQKIQVVGVLESNEQGVYQLARGAGFVVASANQLVKVGGPLESSCKMEGMLQSILEKEEEMKRKLHEIRNLAARLKQKIVLEQDKPEEVPVISLPPIAQKSSHSSDGELSPSGIHESKPAAIDAQTSLETGPNPTTPTRNTCSYPSSPVGGSAGRQSVASVDSTVVNLGISPKTPSQTPAYYTGEPGLEFAHSPARSCPIPSINETAHLTQPFLDDEAPSSTGVLRYRVNNDDETSGLGWAGVLGCGTSLFGERVLDSSDHGAATSIFNTTTNRQNDLLNMPFDQNALMQRTNAQRRAAALAAVAAGPSGYQGIAMLESSGSADSPLRRGGSFDGGGGINFRTGMSGHSGLGKPKRDFSCDQQLTHGNSEFNLPRRRSMMSEMSQHRGAAIARLGPRSSVLNRSRGAAPDTLVGCQTIR